MKYLSAIMAFLNILQLIVERINAARIKREYKAELERDALARQLSQKKDADVIDKQVSSGDIDALRERMRDYRRPD